MLELLKNAGHVFEKGGPVLWVLLGVSVVSVALAFERAIFWLGQHRPGRRAWIRKAVERLKSGDVTAVRALVGGDTSLYAGVIDELLSARLSDSTAVGLVEERRGAIERFNGALSTIITAAPLLGLLGTVTGIIRSFDVIGNASAVRDIPMVAQGVSEALINTAAGLGVALFTLVPYVVCRAQSERCLSAIESLAAAAAQGRSGGHSTGSPQNGSRATIAVTPRSEAPPPQPAA